MKLHTLGLLAAAWLLTANAGADVVTIVSSKDNTLYEHPTDDLSNGPDPTPADNTGSDTDTLNAAPDYTITKDDGLATAQPGDRPWLRQGVYHEQGPEGRVEW